ncbi:MAG: alanine racemase [Deltaproteobacteria bacterium]
MAPRLVVNLNAVTENTRKTIDRCRGFGVEVVGVTKGVSGLPSVAKAMVEGGISTLGDSRLKNIIRMREAGLAQPMVLIRSPAPSEVEETVRLCSASLNVDVTVLRALSEQALRFERTHDVVLMVDLDTGREGILPSDLPGVIREILALKGLALRGLGAYFDMRSDDARHKPWIARLVRLAEDLGKAFNSPLSVVSGGSSNVFRSLVLEGEPVPGLNQLRIGTAILLGLSASIGPRRIQDFHHDTFVLDAELIEVKKRDRILGILALGTLDADPRFLFPKQRGIQVLRATSDHTLVDLTESQDSFGVGNRLSFELGYPALSRLLASSHSQIEYC